MRDLNYHLKNLTRRNRDGSHATQAARWRNLDLMANQLHELGYKNLSVTGLKPKHVNALVARWKDEGITTGTLKNRIAHIRWWAEKIGKTDMIPPNNTALNIGRRQYVTNESKALTLAPDALDKISDNYIKASLELQAAFGLRREEAIKFQPAFADKGDKILLKNTWTKGGQAREIPIRTDAQRAALAQAHHVAGDGSLIPVHLSYVQHLKRYERATQQAGLSKVHGLRHAYAQTRYEELTGWKAPAAGGPVYNLLTKEQKQLDRAVRLKISEEMGHHRINITSVYLGR